MRLSVGRIEMSENSSENQTRQKSDRAMDFVFRNRSRDVSLCESIRYYTSANGPEIE